MVTLSFCIIKEYFQFVAGPIRRATLIYGPDGRSRGVAIVEFTNRERAALVARKYDGIKIDDQPMKVKSLHPCIYAFHF